MADSENARWFITDLCDTLYRSNTTFDFARFVAARRGAMWPLYVQLISSRRSPAFYALAAFWRFASIDLSKLLVLKAFTGLSATQLDLLADDFVRHSLQPLRIPEAWSELYEARAKGEQILILSASVRPVVAAVARSIGASFAASELAHHPKTGLATGELQTDLTGRKHLHLTTMRLDPRTIECVMTDNITDFELMKLGRRRIAIIHNQKAHSKWAPLSPKLIYTIQ